MPAPFTLGRGVLGSDLRLALRRLRLAPGFAVVAVLTLALGMGATTAIFTLFNAVLLGELPVPRPQELTLLGGGQNCCVLAGMQKEWSIFSAPLYRSLRDGTPELAPLAAFQARSTTVRLARSAAAAVPGQGEFVSGNYFAMLGVKPYLGRMLGDGDDAKTSSPAAVLSHRSWVRDFGSDAALVGSAILVDGHPVTVVGIAPAEFYGDTLRPDPPDLWLPLSSEPMMKGESSLLEHPDLQWLFIMGRLRPGQNRTAVAAKLTTELRSWLNAQADIPAEHRQDILQAMITAPPSPAGVGQMAENFGTGLRLLLALSAFVLLIACGNLANLLLARGAGQRAQQAVRAALGAPRGRLIRQTLTESLVLALLGGAAGIGIAFVGTRALLALAFRGAHVVPLNPNPSPAVLLIALAAALLTGILFGVLPAWIGSHSNPAAALRGASRSLRDRASFPQRALVVFQAALSLVLLAGAGLLSSSLNRLEHQDFGFATSGRLSVRVDPLLAGYVPQRLPALYDELERRLGNLPGVKSVGLGLYAPMQDQWSGPVFVAGRASSFDDKDHASWDRVNSQFLEAVGQPIVRGRPFTRRDTATAPRVVVVNETFARLYLAGQDPIGAHFGQDGAARNDYEIVGVARDAKYFEADEPVKPMFFLPLSQPSASHDAQSAHRDARAHYISSIILRAGVRESTLGPDVRRTLAEIDPNLTALSLESLGEEVSLNFNRERLVAALTTLFGILALGLASLGIYGVTSYSVAARTGEIGIRMALGADRGRVLAMVLRSALLQVGIGLALGVPIALAGGKLVASQLFQVGSADPVILTAATAVLATAALAAAFIPARRAAATDPMEAVRNE